MKKTTITPIQKVLETIIDNLERRLVDIDLEIRVLEREKISVATSDEKLLFTENKIRSVKDQRNFYEEKLEVAEDEYNAIKSKPDGDKIISGSDKESKKG